MRQLNGLYTQHVNRRHRRAGHLLQGRYKAILVQRESYLLELTRYVILNPLRANTVRVLEDWPWSSHAYMMATRESPAWLDTDWLLGNFGANRSEAIPRYLRFVMAGVGLASPLKDVSHQLILGNTAFIAKHKNPLVEEKLRDVSKAQRRLTALSLEEYRKHYPKRELAMANAYFSTAFTMAQIANFFGVSPRTVSRAVRHFETPPGLSDCRN